MTCPTQEAGGALRGICTKRYTAGNSLELGRYPPGTPLPTLPGVTPGPKDHLRRRPTWNLWESADSPSGSTSPPLSGIIPGPQDSAFLASSFGSHICTIRYSECVCVCLTKNNITSSVIVLSFQRTVHTAWYCVYLFREQLVLLVP